MEGIEEETPGKASQAPPALEKPARFGFVGGMSKPTPEQLKQVSQWVAEGASLSEVQSRLLSEFGLSLTYMEVRFLVDDLGAVLQDKPEPAAEPAADAVAEPPATPAEDAAAPAAGKVTVATDTLARPGAMVSGKVTFSDGQTAEWYVDNEGRPGLVPVTPGYRPSAEDIQQFQVLLDAEFRKLGY
jgi:hypothetical protein